MHMHACGTIGVEQMDAVVKATGRCIFVTYVDSGSIGTISGLLRSVTPFRNIQVGDNNIPFIGYGIAIRMISVSGNVIYNNREIPKDYNAKKIYETMYFAKKSFTKEGLTKRRVAISTTLRAGQ